MVERGENCGSENAENVVEEEAGDSGDDPPEVHADERAEEVVGLAA